MTYEEVKKRTILLSVVGSTAYGLDVEGSDKDQLGVCIEPIEQVIGLRGHFEQYEGKGEAGDVKVYSLRKFLSLAMKGNPNILELFFITPTYCDARGNRLLELKKFILSRQAVHPYLGYLHAQKLRLIGEKGQKRCHRPENESKYGFDTKYAMHMLRLGFQGVELLRSGKLSFPIPEPDRTYLRSVREGLVNLEECVRRAEELEAEIRKVVDTSLLPDQPSWAPVEDFLISTYGKLWSAELATKEKAAEKRKPGQEGLPGSIL